MLLESSTVAQRILGQQLHVSVHNDRSAVDIIHVQCALTAWRVHVRMLQVSLYVQCTHVSLYVHMCHRMYTYAPSVIVCIHVPLYVYMLQVSLYVHMCHRMYTCVIVYVHKCHCMYTCAPSVIVFIHMCSN